jgi:DNA-binding CsgD family transcriptional regulator
MPMPYWNKAARAREGDALTPRELEILALLAAGHPTREIALRLGVTPGTVKTHLTAVYRKIGVTNRVQAARHYLEHHAGRPAQGDAAGPEAR